MPKEFPPSDPFHKLEATDGFHVIHRDGPAVVTLSCVAYAGGEPTDMGQEGDPDHGLAFLAEVDAPTPAQRGAVTRLKLVTDALCRYFTTGGSWGELEKAQAVMQNIGVGGMVFQGYYLLDSYQTTDTDYQHVFVKDGTREVALWNEPQVASSGVPVGGWIDRTTLDALAEQEEDDNGDRPRRVRAES